MALKLSASIVGRVDVNRLLRELNVIEDALTQGSIRGSGADTALPRISRSLDELVRENSLNLLKTEDRQTLSSFLGSLIEGAPSLHISFASDPPPSFVTKIVTWLRTEIHPLVLIQIGLQPSIAAGCIVRTPNRYFDFSLRRNFAEKRQMLIDTIGAK